MQKKILLILMATIGLLTASIAQAQDAPTQTQQDYIACKALAYFGEKSYPHQFHQAFKDEFKDCQKTTAIKLKEWAENRQMADQDNNKKCGTEEKCQHESQDIFHIINEVQKQTNFILLLPQNKPYTIDDLPSPSGKNFQIKVQLNQDEFAYLNQLLPINATNNNEGKNEKNEEVEQKITQQEDKKKDEANNWFSLNNTPKNLIFIFCLITLGLLAMIIYTTITRKKTTTTLGNDDTSTTTQSIEVEETTKTYTSHNHDQHSLEKENQQLKEKIHAIEKENQQLKDRPQNSEQYVQTSTQSNPIHVNRNTHIHDEYFAETAHSVAPPKPVTPDIIQLYYASIPNDLSFSRQELTTDQHSNSLYKLEHNTITNEVKFEFVRGNSEQASNLALKNHGEFLIPVCDIQNYNSSIHEKAKIIKNIKPGTGRMEGDFCVVKEKCIIELV